MTTNPAPQPPPAYVLTPDGYTVEPVADPAAPCGAGGSPSGIPRDPVRAPRFSREQVVAAVLAGAGILVTLIGVVLLLMMAAREGLLTRPVRVGGGAVLAGALAAAATWIRPRTGGRTGSVALLVTAVAAAYFDVVAVTRLYDWVPLALGLALASVVAAAAGWLAVRWNERILFQAVVVAVATLAPFLTAGTTLALAGFLIVLQLVGVVPEWRCAWEETALTRTVPAVLVASVWALGHPVHAVTTVVVVVAVALIGLAAGTWAGLTRRGVVFAPAALALSWLPVLTLSLRDGTGVWLPLVMTLVGAVALAVSARTEGHTRLVLLGLTSLSALLLAFRCAQGEWRAVPFFVAALALMGVHHRMRTTWLGYAGVASLAVAVIVQGTSTSYTDLFYRSRAADLPLSVLGAGVALLVFSALAANVVRGRSYSVEYLQVVLGAAGTAAVLGLACTLVTILGRTGTGFFAAHLTLTVLSFGIVAVVLTAGISHERLRATSITAGLALGGCAVAKLFCFDLTYMSPVTKVFTFLAAGLVLLGAGTLYARRLAMSPGSTGDTSDRGSVENRMS